MSMSIWQYLCQLFKSLARPRDLTTGANERSKRLHVTHQIRKPDLVVVYFLTTLNHTEHLDRISDIAVITHALPG